MLLPISIEELMKFFICFLHFLFISTTFAGAGVLPSEQEAVYLALESINPEVQWRALYPDDLCLSGPHGVVCDFFSDGAGGFTPHITELNFGFLSDFNSNPGCGINASLPSLFPSSLPFLRRLFFYHCFRFGKTAISAAFWNISSSLEVLVIHDSPTLVGYLSARIAGLLNLRRLIISGTGLSGVIPSEIGQLRNLEQLVLSRNRLRGSVPATLGGLSCLKLLDLSGNHLIGNISPEIGRLAELVKLDLSSNELTGTVPADFARLKKLEFLDLSHNVLTGGVPILLAEMRSLKEVYLSENPLGGRIPEIWETLGGILGLGLSGLGLTGSIPASMGLFLKNICYLSLGSNSLAGELPEQIRLLERSAKEINMENNALYGRIPFTAGFIAMIGGKLKLTGNPELCLDEGVPVHVRGKGNLGYLQICIKTEIHHAGLVSLSSSSPTTTVRFAFFVVFFLLSPYSIW